MSTQTDLQTARRGVESLMVGGRVLPMTRWGDPVMHASTRQVTAFDEELHTLVRDMFATMKASQGVGLAATQVGVDLALFIYDCHDEDERHHYGAVCNPSLSLPQGKDRRLDVAAEGCLSLPGAFQTLGRPDRAVCTGVDPFGHPVTVTGTGLLARCLQHETDHLKGIVFGDRLPDKARRDLYAQHQSVARHYPNEWPTQADPQPTPGQPATPTHHDNPENSPSRTDPLRTS